MDCRQAKERIRQGRASEAAGHLAACEDCAAFAADFGPLAALLNAAPAPAPHGDLLVRTLALARRELTPAPRAPRARVAAAIIAALLLVPLLAAMNFYLAESVRALLARHVPALIGNVWFTIQAAATITTLGVACALLPLLIAAATNRLGTGRTRAAGGAAPAGPQFV